MAAGVKSRGPGGGIGPPILAVTMGDPGGIGPEIVVKALSKSVLQSQALFRVYGLETELRRAAEAAGVAIFWRTVTRGTPAGAFPEGARVVLIDDAEAAERWERSRAAGPSAAGGYASLRFVEDAIVAAKAAPGDAGRADGIVTAPVSKTSWRMAGAGSGAGQGHTELLAERLGAARSAMLFVGPSLRVILVTIHVALMDVRRRLSARSVIDTIELGDRACRELGVDRPRVAVCGLNPHAGEGGLMGTEDEEVIAPAVRRAAEKGIDVRGPLPADAVFLDAAAPPHGKGMYDIVVAMYHDQGLIPVKLLDRERAVNMTVGLPTVRTSPAHGTAFDIAGRNAASEGSMLAAIELAERVVRVRRGG